jgi:hypothetical protein
MRCVTARCTHLDNSLEAGAEAEAELCLAGLACVQGQVVASLHCTANLRLLTTSLVWQHFSEIHVGTTLCWLYIGAALVVIAAAAWPLMF